MQTFIFKELIKDSTNPLLVYVCTAVTPV